MAEENRPTVAVIGTGTIAVGWITLFLAYELPVRVISRRPDAGPEVLAGVAAFAPGLANGVPRREGLTEGLDVGTDLEKALEGADVVQENAPDDLSIKQELFARIGAAAAPGALLLSSTSKLLPADFTALMGDRGRALVGHPFNPPHVVPLVEVVGGPETDPAAIEQALAFYRSVGRTPVLIREPVPMFVANRLQAALLRECVHLVREGVVTVAELDEVVTTSIGLRWATTGPFRSFHLAGGRGGLRHWLGSLGTGLERSWQQLGSPALDDGTVRAILDQADAAFGDRTYEELADERDRRQNAVLRALAEVSREESGR
ncbi:3-hydroxyacyl-CoA dehydrogenase NAD-binding domain-containing protein [Frankia sp. AiPs1]|uniref:3-hydroxyacyl-CoA dehydrogenase NAD-binding domain-containing protein n=1 Tax=Frankia sp. AiPs1 TaxID=573493 RepID=UPI002043BCE8|nr:3-hydroxyacyl-CoA dehydrogenase NAD-binding domain-containing protein [Frankia sp. AiPs1]MCM3920968.1 3-hydroxyacyl-CoA dehydrogenase NAD-binding domain-containing protein [Frankia sp. AiPs1]